MRTLAVLLGTAFALAAAGCATYDYDVLIVEGTIVDGTGRAPYTADIGIRGDRIVEIGTLTSRRGWIILPASGRVVTPGFMNPLGRSRERFTSDHDASVRVLSGITSEIVGESESPAFRAGQSAGAVATANNPGDILRYRRMLEYRGVPLNVGSVVPVSQLLANCPSATTRPDDCHIEALLEQAMKDGALGISASVDHASAASGATNGIRAYAHIAAQHGGTFMTRALQTKARGASSVHAALSARVEARPSVVIVDAEGGRSAWRHAASLVPHIDEARATGALVTAIIVAASDGSIPSLDERTLVLRPWVTFGLDFAAAVTEPPSPPEAAPTDAVAALFHRYVDAKVMTFEEIVRRMTSAVANQFCLTDRGILAAGMYADVLILNRDARTLPTAVNPETVPSAWVEAVVINGFVAARDGKYMNMRVGQLLSRGR